MAFNQPTSGQNPNARKPRKSRQEPQQQPYDNQQPTGNEPYRQQPGWTFQQTPPAPFVEEPMYTTKENKSKPRVFLNQCKKTWNSWGKGKKAAAIIVALSLFGAAAGDKDEGTKQEPPAPSPTVAAAHMTQNPTATPPMVTSTPEAVRAAATMPPLVYQTAAPVKPTATPRPTATPKPKSTKAPTATPKPTNTKEPRYILNTKTKKFHYAGCYTIEDMDWDNREESTRTQKQLKEMGYEPCEKCRPR